jgi:hypothetical protein
MKWRVIGATLGVAILLASHAHAAQNENDESDESAVTPSLFERKLAITLEHNEKLNEYNATLHKIDREFKPIIEEYERKKALVHQKTDKANGEYFESIFGSKGRPTDEVYVQIETTESPRIKIEETTKLQPQTLAPAATASPQMTSGKHPHGQAQVIIDLVPGQPIAIHSQASQMLTEMSRQLGDYKIAAYSIVGAFRQGKSFFMDYCLRFLYANVSKKILNY